MSISTTVYKVLVNTVTSKTTLFTKLWSAPTFVLVLAYSPWRSSLLLLPVQTCRAFRCGRGGEWHSFRGCCFGKAPHTQTSIQCTISDCMAGSRLAPPFFQRTNLLTQSIPAVRQVADGFLQQVTLSLVALRVWYHGQQQRHWIV